MSGDAVENKTKLSKDLDKNMQRLDSILAVDKSFDLLKREIIIGEHRVTFYFVDAFNKNEVMALIQFHFTEINEENLSTDAFHDILYRELNFVEVDQLQYLEEVVDKVMAGPLVLLIEGSDRAISVDVRTYPARPPMEPDLERVVRGPRDGFVETIVFNTELIRRRIRDPYLRVEFLRVGDRSKTDISICYIENIANPELVKTLKDKLKRIKIDGLPMAEKAIEELITPGTYWNPYPKVRFTERPDVAAAHIYEGHVLIVVDTSPSVIIAPATFFHHVQHAEEYRESPAVGVYVRWVRLFGIFVSIFLLPVWLMLALHPELLPPALDFIGPKKSGQVPIFLQFILAEIAVDMLRLSTIHTPSALATALGIIATLLIGEMAVTVGLFNVEVIMYTAVAAIGIYMTPSYELAMANRLARLVLLVAAGFFGLPGFILATALFIFWLASNKSFGIPYLWPLFPFHWKGMLSVLVRTPVPITNTRFDILKPQDRYRQRSKRGAPSPAGKPEPERQPRKSYIGMRRRKK